MEELKVGLIKGRHEMPVTEYIIDWEIGDIFADYDRIKESIIEFILKKVGVNDIYGQCINSTDYTDVKMFRGKKHLIVYVTGLTIVTAELIRICAYNGIALDLMHYDSKSGEYVKQSIFA